MKTGSQTRLLAIVLAFFTLAAFGLAVANFVQESGYQQATDGVRWTEVPGGLRAEAVPTETPGYRAGIRSGDLLTAINTTPTRRLATAEREITRSGVYSRASYSLQRSVAGQTRSAPLEIEVILAAADRTDFQVGRLTALIYLAIGLYVLLRRWTAPKSTHFYVFCLVSFVLYAFRYTGMLDGLDQLIYWSNECALALQPALFLHFALSFNAEGWRRPSLRLLDGLLYLPGAILVLLRLLSLLYWSATERLQHRLDKIDYAYMAGCYVLAALIFWLRYRREVQPLQRQQLKWLSRGTLLTVLPFTILYVLPFLADANVPGALAKVAVLSLTLLPLTFSWAIVKYRLMDVDLIFKRGVAYTLATAALVGLYFGVVAITAEVVRTRIPSPSLRSWGLVAATIVTGLLFDPLKRAIQARVDRLFDQKKFDYRETIVAFGRELNAQTDLNALTNSIVERLPMTLLVTRVAVFLPTEARPGNGSGSRPRFSMAASHGLSTASLAPESLDLGFLDFDRNGADTHLFFETPQSVLRLSEAQREAAAALDLNYYVPCRAARHDSAGLGAIAVLGLGRTGEGDFLSSEDIELLESLAGYIGIAIQNAQLYHRLEQKMLDFERLHEFNENIVESINIGVFAVDLKDQIESWNTQMEVMYATSRAEALRRPLHEVFPPEFVAEFDRLRGDSGVATLYKFRLPVPSGEIRTANITVAPLLTRDMQVVGRILLVDDITERINMEGQLAQAEKLSSIGLLAAGVAHEVNTPLAVISSYAQMLGKQLRADDATNARLKPVLDKITQQTFRASEIVNGLLNFSRMGSSELTRVDLNAVARDTALLLEHQLRSTMVSLRTVFAEGLPSIQGNRGKLQQVLVNLVMNSRDALQETPSGRIEISTSVEGDTVQLRVEDNGAGMSPGVLRHIYDPFFTTKSTPREGQHKGTGLGLAVTYGIVQEHAGTIHVESTEGHGTVFRLDFPAAPREDAANAGGAKGSGAAGRQPAESKVVHA